MIERIQSPIDGLSKLFSELEAESTANYPPDQRHGLKLQALFQPHIRFFVVRANGLAIGCGGVALFAEYAELKRLFVAKSARGRGVGHSLLARLEAEARQAGLGWLRLETGDLQQPAIRLYARLGFVRCEAFGSYAAMSATALVSSVFLEKRLK